MLEITRRKFLVSLYYFAMQNFVIALTKATVAVRSYRFHSESFVVLLL